MLLKKLHHVAYRCMDAQTTHDFYANLLGLKFAMMLNQEHVPSTGEYWPHTHIFFEMEDGSYIAFFELLTAPAPQKDKNTPEWVQHLALEVDDLDTLNAAKVRLTEAGVKVLGPVDHDFCQSIYFFDPSGHRLEMSVRSDEPGELAQAEAQAALELEVWNRLKQQHLQKAAAH
jgi:catechol 2,3-dioxygenase-like lactoylglutathione lyase family enzyme